MSDTMTVRDRGTQVDDWIVLDRPLLFRHDFLRRAELLLLRFL